MRANRPSLIAMFPPLALRLWRYGRGVGFHTFRGQWPNIRDVPSTPGGYDDETIATIYAARLGAQHCSDDGRGRWILPSIVAGYDDRPVTVLDFGGGACVGLRCINGTVGKLPNLQYVLIETPSLCRALNVIVDDRRVRIQTDIPAAIDSPLVVNASSSLQYVPDYVGTLERLLNLRPDSFVLSLTSVSDLPTYARQQCNIPHRRFGAWVFEQAELLNVVAKHNYRCVFQIDHDLPVTHADALAPSRFSSMVFRSSTQWSNNENTLSPINRRSTC